MNFFVSHFLAVALVVGVGSAGCTLAARVEEPPAPFDVATAKVATKQTAPIVLLEPEAPGEMDTAPPANLSAAERAELARLVREEPSAQVLWRQIEAQAQTVLDDEPRPLEVIAYEGRVKNTPERIETVEKLTDVNKLTLLGYAFSASTGEEQEKYARKMREFILAWTNAYKPTGNPINENKLESLWQSYAMLRDTGTFSDAEKTEIEAWMRELGEAELEYAKRNPNSTKNNWHTKRLKIMAQLGAILNEPKFSDYAAREVKEYVEASLRSDGTSRDLEHRDAMSYHVSGLTPFLVLARDLGKEEGRKLYFYESPSGASLQKSVKFVIPYVKGEKEYPQWRNTRVKLDRDRAAAGLPEYQPGVLWDPRSGSALEMFELASAFEPELMPLVYELSGANENVRFPTWNLVLVAAQSARDTP